MGASETANRELFVPTEALNNLIEYWTQFFNEVDRIHGSAVTLPNQVAPEPLIP